MFIKVYHRKIVRRTSQRSVNKDSLQPQMVFREIQRVPYVVYSCQNVPSNHMSRNISTLQQSKGLRAFSPASI